MTLRQLRDSLTSEPFNALLGMRLHRVHRDGITIDCKLRDDLRNSAGVAHGGIAAAIAGAAVGGAIRHHFGGGLRIATVELISTSFYQRRKAPSSPGRTYFASAPHCAWVTWISPMNMDVRWEPPSSRICSSIPLPFGPRTPSLCPSAECSSYHASLTQEVVVPAAALV